MSRHTEYNTETAARICELIADGKSLRRICTEDDTMPHRATVSRWLNEQDAFATDYARAREFQADLMDEKILDTADACTPETAPADKVKISAYQWRASKLAPKKFGDRLDLNHAGEVGLKVEIVRFDDDQASG